MGSKSSSNRQTFNRELINSPVDIAGPHVLIDSEKAAGYPTATKAMLAGYVIKTTSHLALGGYLLYWNRRWDRMAIERGEMLDDGERRKRAEEIGMTDATEFSE